MDGKKSLVVDASAVIGLCAREKDKYELVLAELGQYTGAGYHLFAPGVLIAEVLFILCQKSAAGTLSRDQHVEAIENLHRLLEGVKPPPEGDGPLVKRAEEIRASYGRARSADGIYLALTEELGRDGTAEILTFDEGMRNQAARNCPSVSVKVLERLDLAND